MSFVYVSYMYKCWVDVCVLFSPDNVVPNFSEFPLIRPSLNFSEFTEIWHNIVKRNHIDNYVNLAYVIRKVSSK